MLEFKVEKQKLTRLDVVEPATDSEQYLKAKFTIKDADWNGKARTALFRLGESVYKALLDSNNECVVPSEVLIRTESKYARTQGSKIYVSLIGEYSTTRITTDEVSVVLNASGYSEALTPAAPTESEYQQIITQYANNEAAINEAKAECETARADLVGVKNIFANAIKGNLSGAVVRADDVSPFEHNPVVKVHGKNFFDISKIPTMTASSQYAYISEVGSASLVITTPEGYTGNGYCTIAKTMKDVCPSLEIGKTYILSATTQSNSTNIYLSNVGKSWIFGGTMTITEKILNSPLTFYGLSAKEGMGTGNCTISNIQIEEGKTATPYEPYIDPSTMTVTRCGKNVLGYADNFEITQDGLTISYDAASQLFTINGTPEKASFSINFGGYLFGALAMPIGIDVALSVEHISGTLSVESATNVFYLGNSDSAAGERNNWFSVPFPTSKRKTNVSTATKKYFNRTWLYIGGEHNVTFTDYKFRVQLEMGTEVTDYDKFKGVKFTPASDGTVEGVTSLSPNMTILTDTEGAIVECEYIKDTNKVIQKIADALNITI